jgi:hypothetical protein
MLIAIWTQTAVLAFTAYLIWRYTNATEKYTAETAALRAEAVRQTKMSVRPIVLPEFPAAGVGNFRLRNCGEACALNIQVLPVGTMHFDGGELGMGQIESRFEPIEYLPADEAAEVNTSTWANEQKMQNSPFDHWFLPRLTGEETTITITFDDIEGRRYRLQAIIPAEQNLANLPRKVRLGRIEEVNP